MPTNRRIIMFNRVSADGYFATEDGALDWVTPEPALEQAAAAQLPTSDAMIFGRRTYEMFESFWPRALDDSTTSPDPHANRRSAELRAMAVWINDATKVVFSRTLKTVAWKNTRLVHEFDAREVEAMKRQPGQDIMIFGSGSVVALFAEHGLIDEYRFVVNPVLLGRGQSMLKAMSTRVALTHAETTSYPSGVVMLRYRPRE